MKRGREKSFLSLSVCLFILFFTTSFSLLSFTSVQIHALSAFNIS